MYIFNGIFYNLLILVLQNLLCTDFTYSMSQFRLVTFEVLNNYACLTAAMPDDTTTCFLYSIPTFIFFFMFISRITSLTSGLSGKIFHVNFEGDMWGPLFLPVEVFMCYFYKPPYLFITVF